MRYPQSEHLGIARAPDGKTYNCEFYGENEGAAVVTGPKPPPNAGRLVQVPEVHREDAKDTAEARAKLSAWVRAKGWTWA